MLKSQKIKPVGQAVALALSLVAFTGAFAQGAAPAQADIKFVNDAAMGGIAEVKLSEIAQKNAGAPDVKQFAEQMIKDHTAANQELMQITGAKGINPPADTDAAHKKMAAKLESASGPAFDKQYMTGMVADHKKTVALFKKEAASGTDPELKAFAAKQLPALTGHLQMAQALQGKTSGKMAQAGGDPMTTPTSTDANVMTRTKTGEGAAPGASGGMSR